MRKYMAYCWSKLNNVPSKVHSFKSHHFTYLLFVFAVRVLLVFKLLPLHIYVILCFMDSTWMLIYVFVIVVIYDQPQSLSGIQIPKICLGVPKFV